MTVGGATEWGLRVIDVSRSGSKYGSGSGYPALPRSHLDSARGEQRAVAVPASVVHDGAVTPTERHAREELHRS